jgi:putative tricarboxylic transport membrane protein
MAISVRAALGVALPLAVAAACAALATAFVAPGVDLDAMTRGVIGPATWPKAMLYCAAAAAGLLALAGLLEVFAPHPEGKAGGAAQSDYHEGRSLGAVALVMAYGIALPLAGFAWTTLAFIAAWLVLSGVRRLLFVALVSVLGTLGVLYLFVKVSLMPLDRGTGVFEQATVALYRVLGIY